MSVSLRESPRYTTPVVIYTDGSCDPRLHIGAWAAWLKYRKREKTIYGVNLHTNPMRMEMIAAIKALELLQYPCQVILFTDSGDLVNGARSYLHRTKNGDLWNRLEQLMRIHSVRWKWVPAHKEDNRNRYVDQLARCLLRQLRKEQEWVRQ